MRISDWSSDVCSADLDEISGAGRAQPGELFGSGDRRWRRGAVAIALAVGTKDRKSVVSGKGVSVRVALGGRRLIKKKIHASTTHFAPSSKRTSKDSTTYI